MQSGVCMKSVLVVATAFTLAATGAAQAAPILVTASGLLVQQGALPDFAAPISDFADIHAYWVIDPDAGVKVTTPLPMYDSGESVAFRGSVLEFGAIIYSSGVDPLVLTNSSSSLGQAYLYDNLTIAGIAFDMFGFGAGAFVNESGLVREIDADRDLGEGVFISGLNLFALQLTFLPDVPGLLEDDSFPDLGRVFGGTAQIDLSFSHGTPTTTDEIQALPYITFTATFPSISYTYLDDVETPEPATLGLFGLGLAAVALRRRRRAA